MKIDKNKIFAVIMAGGKGERLWPLSTEERPKPLISLNGQQTLLEDTVQHLYAAVERQRRFRPGCKSGERLLRELSYAGHDANAQ